MSGKSDNHLEDGCCSHNSAVTNDPSDSSFLNDHWRSLSSFVLLLLGLIFDYLIENSWFVGNTRLVWYLIAYVPVAYPVVKQAIKNLIDGDIFTEFFLMSIATFGAFYIGEYPEGVAVMLFYSIGEAFQHSAVKKAKLNIKSLLDVRSETAHLKTETTTKTVHPKDVDPGDIILVKPGERIPLDGQLLTEISAFDTSAITGESKPRHFEKGDSLSAGFINLNRVIELKVTKTYENSSISRILTLVEEATSRKAKTELFIRSFARIYTPVVVLFASLLVLLPFFFIESYVFNEWLYRGLVFLVISCPCAFVISVPLGYFGGIGAASRNGILVKGSNYLDVLKDVDTVIFDKTGTLTKGVFDVQKIKLCNKTESEILPLVFAVETQSSHPIAKAITKYIKQHIDMETFQEPVNQEEVPGQGVKAYVDDKYVVVGNRKLLENENVVIDENGKRENGTIAYISVNGHYEGFIIISDQIKDDTKEAISSLRKLGVKRTVLMSGDSVNVAEAIAQELDIDEVYSELIPEEKAEKFQELKRKYKGVVGFAGDGINDAPVLALSDIGIAMGAMGSDVAIETADVVIQTDQPSKIATAIKIGRATRNIVWQNISLAFGVKLIVLVMGAFGIATLWEAVFADVGVALLAVLNAVRIQNQTF